jgi:hypothetical protein
MLLNIKFLSIFVVPGEGIEPPTFGLQNLFFWRRARMPFHGGQNVTIGLKREKNDSPC